MRIKKKFLLGLLSIILITSTIKNSRASVTSGIGSSLVGLYLAKTILDAKDDLRKHCVLDPTMLLAPAFSSGPEQEMAACSGQTTALAVSTFAAYKTARYLAEVGTRSLVVNARIAASTCANIQACVLTTLEEFGVQVAAEAAGLGAATGIALAYIGTLYAISEGASDYIKICPDDAKNDKQGNHPFSYTDEQIIGILKKSGVQSLTRDLITEKYDKICIVNQKDSTKITWLKRNECTTINGVIFCAYSYKGNRNLLCVRTSSTCPCRHEIDGGSSDAPSVEADGGGLRRDSEGKLQITESDSNFLRHCRVLRASDAFMDDTERRFPIVDRACMDFVGSSKSIGGFRFTAPAAECLISSLRNIIEKSIQVDPIIKTIDPVIKNQIDALEQDNVVLNKIMTQIYSIGSNSDPSVCLNLYFNQTYIQIKDFLVKLKNGSDTDKASIGITMHTKYTDDILKIPNEPFITSASQDCQSDMIKTYNVISDITETISELISAKQNSGNILSETMFSRLQGSVKGIILFGFVLYIMLIGLKLFLGEMEMKTKDIIEKFIQIGLISYFAIGDGWKDYGLNLLMRASQGIAEVTMDIISVDQRDMCSFGLKQFEIDSDNNGTQFSDPKLSDLLKKSSYYISKGLPSDPKFIVEADSNDNPTSQGLNAISVISGQGNTDVIRNICRDQYPNSASVGYPMFIKGEKYGNKTFLCNRGPFLPRPNYEYPMIPVEISSEIGTLVNNNKYPYSDYMPVRCMDKNGILLWCDTADCSGIIIKGSGNFPYYAKPTSMNGKDVMVCNQLTNEGAKAYTADGYHIDDLFAMKYITLETQINLPANTQGLIETGYYSGTRTGGYIVPSSISNGTTNIFQNRMSRMKVSIATDQDRIALNKKFRAYPIIKTNTGSIRNLSYLYIFDLIDCKIGKYIMFKGGSIPRLATMAFQIAFSSIMGVISSVTILTMMMLIFVSFLKIAQNFIVGMAGLIFMLYISPIIIPMGLFERTKGLFETWKENIKAYVIYPPATFILIPFILKIIDTTMIGDLDWNKYLPDGTQNPNYNPLFLADGSVNPDCLKNSQDFDEIKEAPYLCLVEVLASKSSWAPQFFLGLMLLPVTPFLAIGAAILTTAVSSGVLGKLSSILFYKSLGVLIVIAISSELIDKFEASLGEIIGKADVALKGGIGSIGAAVSAKQIAGGVTDTMGKAMSSARNIGSGTKDKIKRSRALNKNDDGEDQK